MTNKQVNKDFINVSFNLAHKETERKRYSQTSIIRIHRDWSEQFGEKRFWVIKTMKIN